MTFAQNRAYISHSILRNGILDRFNITPDVYHAPPSRLKSALLDQLSSLSSASDNQRYALLAWQGAPGYEPGLQEAVLKLLLQANELESFKPTDRFPSHDQIMIWLTNIGDLLTRLDEFCQLEGPTKQAWAERFVTALVSLTEFIHGLDIGSSHFTEYFRKKA
jgi:hypothetical protein